MNRLLLIALLLVTALLATAHAQAAQKELLANAIEVTAIAEDAINLKIHNTSSDSFYVTVCDTPPRLCSHSSDIERYDGKEWKRVTPPSGVLGDFVGTSLVIPTGQIAAVPLRFSPAFLGITKGMKIRVVVRAMQSTVTGTQGLRLISPAFAFKPRKATKQ